MKRTLSAKKIPLTDIKERDTDQRETPKGVPELADSIKRIGLLSPILLDDDNTLVAGRCRLAAFEYLHTIEGLKDYEKIPAIYLKDLDGVQKKIVELEENIRRSNLTWKEESRAVRDLRKIIKQQNPKWSADKIAAYFGYKRSHMASICNVADALDAGNERVETAATLTAAINVVERDMRRKMDNETNQLWEEINEAHGTDLDEDQYIETEQDGEEDAEGGSLPSSTSRPRKRAGQRTPNVICADFADWARDYDGPKFNLIHCDFPYGIEHGRSAQGRASSGGGYNDSPDVYWRLCRTLARYRDKLLYPSAHMIFWFSMKYYTETMEFFAKEMPEMDVDYQPLIWVKSDNKGIVRNVKHLPRNITETAFLINRGGREVIQPVANAISAPTVKDRHISEKPTDVLEHFFRMCCDHYSEVLDPTAGSGSSLVAATRMGATRVYGMDIDMGHAKAANKWLEEERAKQRRG